MVFEPKKVDKNLKVNNGGVKFVCVCRFMSIPVKSEQPWGKICMYA